MTSPQEAPIEKYKFSTEQAKADGFIESIVYNTWFREDTNKLYAATSKGFVVIGGSKEFLPKDENGKIEILKEIHIKRVEDKKAELEKSLSEMGVLCWIIAKHQQNYLDGICGLKKLMVSHEFAVINRLRKANLDFITKTDNSMKKANLDIEKLENMVYTILDKIEEELKKL